MRIIQLSLSLVLFMCIAKSSRDVQRAPSFPCRTRHASTKRRFCIVKYRLYYLISIVVCYIAYMEKLLQKNNRMKLSTFPLSNKFWASNLSRFTLRFSVRFEIVKAGIWCVKYSFTKLMGTSYIHFGNIIFLLHEQT